MYPPTHEGKLLQDRIKLIKEHFPQFLEGDKMLDVGCNRGEFMKIGKWKKRVGFDNVDYPMSPDGSEYYSMGFKDFYYHEQFDRIFAGNVLHHVHKECGGFEWIGKLAALCQQGGLLLVEGPRDNICPDIDIVEWDNFIEEMEEYFILLKCIPTISYTPERYMMLFIRTEYPDFEDIIEKKYKIDNYVLNNPVDIMVASLPKGTTQIQNIGLGYWKEEKIKGEPYKYFENERELFKLHCKHNIHLAKIGYMDFDSATINYMKPSNIYFDKSATIPIKKIKDNTPDGYIKLFRQSYKTIPVELLDGVRLGMMNRDASLIQKAYEEILCQI